MSAEAVEAAAAALAACGLGDAVRRHVPLGPLTTSRVGGAAALFVELADVAAVDAVRRAVRASAVPVLVVGRGSNLLVADAGFEGLAVTLTGAFAAIEVLDGHRVRAGGAVSLPVLARRTAAAGLAGFEWAVGVPGSVGGAVRMNAGGHGSDMAGSLVRCRVADLSAADLTAADLSFTGGGDPGAGRTDHEVGVEALALGYRTSSVEAHQIVLDAVLQLSPGDREVSEATIAEVVRWRREHQPGGQNAGSVFANPPGDSAGRLIEQAGLKGYRRGSARVSEKHANFFQADEGGAADDVRLLVEEVRRRVEEETGIVLVTELRMVGFT